MPDYPFKHPKLYGEAAAQGKEKSELAAAMGLTGYQLRLRQRIAFPPDM